MKTKELTMKESNEARGMRESIEEMERELVELDRDIAEAKKGDKGEMGRVALENFQAMRKGIVEMIASNKELYKTVLESEALEARLGSASRQICFPLRCAGGFGILTALGFSAAQGRFCEFRQAV